MDVGVGVGVDLIPQRVSVTEQTLSKYDAFPQQASPGPKQIPSALHCGVGGVGVRVGVGVGVGHAALHSLGVLPLQIQSS